MDLVWTLPAYVVAALAPPSYYAQEPKFHYEVYRLPNAELRVECAGAFDPDSILLGCTDISNRVVIIDDSLRGDAFMAVLEHEWAHLNGWIHAQPSKKENLTAAARAIREILRKNGVKP